MIGLSVKKVKDRSAFNMIFVISMREFSNIWRFEQIVKLISWQSIKKYQILRDAPQSGHKFP